MAECFTKGKYRLIGIYHGNHPGLFKIAVDRWWGVVEVDGDRRINLYKISRMGNRFWFPGGYEAYMDQAGLGMSSLNAKDLIALIDKRSKIVDDSPIVDFFENLFHDFKSYIDKNNVSPDVFDYVPPDWADGLWFSRRYENPEVVLSDAKKAQAHAEAMSEFHDWLQADRQRYHRSIDPTLPRHLGETPEGEKVVASVGRFGSYVKYDQTYVSTKGEDPCTIDLETALRFIADKKEFLESLIILDFPDHEIQVLNGRFGPYISSVDKKNVKVPKERDPKSMTLAECIKLLEKAPFKPKKKAKKKVAKKKAKKKVDKY